MVGVVGNTTPLMVSGIFADVAPAMAARTLSLVEVEKRFLKMMCCVLV
jgi:hypothetical protein